MGKPHPSPDEPVGPTITSIIDCRDQPNPLDGFVIEEGAVPGPLVPWIHTMIDLTPGKVHPKDLTFNDRFRRFWASASSRFGRYYSPNGSIEKTQVYLIMSHDDNQAVLTLENGKPFLEFQNVGRSAHVEKLKEKLQKATESLEGDFVDNPFSAMFRGQEVWPARVSFL